MQSIVCILHVKDRTLGDLLASTWHDVEHEGDGVRDPEDLQPCVVCVHPRRLSKSSGLWAGFRLHSPSGMRYEATC